jgi:hypothetical protein
MNSNKIENFEDLDCLKHNPELRLIYLQGNPVTEFPGYRQKLMELIPEIEQIDSFFIKQQFTVKFSK